MGIFKLPRSTTTQDSEETSLFGLVVSLVKRKSQKMKIPATDRNTGPQVYIESVAMAIVGWHSNCYCNKPGGNPPIDLACRKFRIEQGMFLHGTI